uniref:Uncharacterized protein n=1 Tax=Glossina palpalis gambiensis TaxID=67801 RepID=A0A1B0C395_9MUSC
MLEIESYIRDAENTVVERSAGCLNILCSNVRGRNSCIASALYFLRNICGALPGGSICTAGFGATGESITLLNEDSLLNKLLNLKEEKQPLTLKWTGDITREENHSIILTLTKASKAFARENGQQIRLNMKKQLCNDEDPKYADQRLGALEKIFAMCWQPMNNNFTFICRLAKL